MDDNDKIIRLSEMLKVKANEGDEFVIVFPESDADNDFAIGDTERLLTQAAQLQNLEIVIHGRESAKLRPRPPETETSGSIPNRFVF